MFYLINKPAGISSFGVLRKLRKILNIKKIGHTGTLDPFATGCLLVATEKSTKLIPMLESSKKEYIATIRFDGKTLSYDTETPVLEVDLNHYSRKPKQEIETFLLNQKSQIPPQYSAIHVDGKRSYDLARKGKEFTLTPRDITVFEAEVLKQDEFELTIKLLVSSGCYMRSFWPMLWNFLGTDGWYLTQLQRTKILWKHNEFTLDRCRDLDNPEGISFSSIFHTIHTYEVSDEIIEDIIHWKSMGVDLFDFTLKDHEVVFLKNMNRMYASLVERRGDEIHILKNDIE